MEIFRPTTILQQSTTPSQTILNVKKLSDDPARVFEVWPSHQAHHLCVHDHMGGKHFMEMVAGITGFPEIACGLELGTWWLTPICAN